MIIPALLLAFAALSALAAKPAPLPPVLPGWDACKWNDPAHQTPKYAIGRIMATVSPSPNGLAAIAPAVNVLFPGTSLVDSGGMDKINIPCVGIIDMVVDSGGKERPDSGQSWDWQVIEDKCETCRPNKCEQASKSGKCGAAPAAPQKSKGGSAGGSSRNHPDRSAEVARAKEELEAAGQDLSGPCGAFAIVKLAGWRMGGGAGLLAKPAGDNCEGYATDIIVYPDGRHYDVLVDGGGRNGPAWGDAGTVDPSRYRPAVKPAN